MRFPFRYSQRLPVFSTLAGTLNVCWYYYPRRGGFVTRPAFNGREMPENGCTIAGRGRRPNQGGLQTRPYHRPGPVRVSSTNKCWEYRPSGTGAKLSHVGTFRETSLRGYGMPHRIGWWFDKPTMMVRQAHHERTIDLDFAHARTSRRVPLPGCLQGLLIVVGFRLSAGKVGAGID